MSISDTSQNIPEMNLVIFNMCLTGPVMKKFKERRNESKEAMLINKNEGSQLRYSFIK